MSWAGISADLRRMRKARKMPLSRLARLAGTSVATASRYESGWTRFELATLRRLATALGYRMEISWHLLDGGAPRETEADLVRRLGRLFWDRALQPGDMEQYPRWVVGRVIQFGKVADIRALSEFFGRGRFLTIVADLRMPSAKMERFWLGLLRLEGIPCTKKPSLPPAASSWPA
jgi:transcriptional regulator with XRE-family HTH domain